jgi:hypothetical protein
VESYHKKYLVLVTVSVDYFYSRLCLIIILPAATREPSKPPLTVRILDNCKTPQVERNLGGREKQEGGGRDSQK